VILGHSERRADHGESDALVRAKVEAAWRAGLMAILCLGESEEERDAGRALEVVERQLRGSLPEEGGSASRLVVAYEPVWAIGTGRTAQSGDIAQMHDHLRELLVELLSTEGEDVRVLYGGSVKPDNAGAIFALENVDGGLVGGASLKADDFLKIVEAAG
jgi:triosephosphate isomerase